MTQFMRVAEYHNNSDVRIVDAPRPEPVEGGILVRVMACGICGSDVTEWFRLPKAPRVLGHEISGVVAESTAPGIAVGDRIVLRNQAPCGARTASSLAMRQARRTGPSFPR